MWLLNWRIHDKIRRSDLGQIFNLTKCLKPCSYKKYSLLGDRKPSHFKSKYAACLVFFDPIEREIEYGVVAEIPKLGSQWKVILDFKPTQYAQNDEPIPPSHLLTFSVKEPLSYRPVSLGMSSSSLSVAYGAFRNNKICKWK